MQRLNRLFSVRFSAGLHVERTLSLPFLTCDFENFVSLADIMPFARAQGQVFAPFMREQA
jgi:hypothetical protein